MNASHIIDITDASNNMNIVNASNSKNIEDASNNINIVYASNNINIVVASNNMNIIDASNNINIIDASNNINIVDASNNINIVDANEFTKGLDQFIDVVEREEYVFNVEVKDPGAPVEFYMKGEKVSRSDPRCEYVNLGEGRHQLIIHSIKMEDLGLVECRTPSNRGDQVLVSSATFDVTKGEDAPEIG